MAAAISACAVQPRMLPLAEVTRASDCRQASSQTPSHITWILPDAPEQRAKLDAACAGIGPVVVQTASGGSLSSSSPLTIVVWNTFLGRGNVDELVSKLERGDFTGGQRVDRFALVLQEVFRTPILEFAAAPRVEHRVCAGAQARERR